MSDGIFGILRATVAVDVADSYTSAQKVQAQPLPPNPDLTLSCREMLPSEEL